ncbi:VanZ family protein [Saliniradius amylolyticus]|uniref:VanZ family protein n=1 Tax=Saliniradius amylolyticus TaxID=2183582 RepID=UPI001EF61C8F|nr:VanZ family protein [Saliniradius amylolyticus]
MRRYIRHQGFFALLIAALVLLFALLWAPADNLPVRGGNDKLHHGLYFMGLCVLMKLSLRLKDQWLVGLLFSIAVLSELSQYSLPYRSASWGDLLADSLGIALGYGMIFSVYFIKRRKLCGS